MAIQTGLEGRPWYVSAVAGLVIGGLLFAAGYWLVCRKQRESIAEKDLRLAEVRQRVLVGRAAQRELPRIEEEVRRLDLQLERLLRILPTRRNTPELMRQMRALAGEASFDLLLFRPGNYVEQDFYVEWPIAIEVDGAYHSLGRFFDRVSHLSRIVNIDDLQITPIAGREAQGRHTIHATFTAKTFIYREPEPEASQDPANLEGTR